jgi:hypothetical protein
MCSSLPQEILEYGHRSTTAFIQTRRRLLGMTAVYRICRSESREVDCEVKMLPVVAHETPPCGLRSLQCWGNFRRCTAKAARRIELADASSQRGENRRGGGANGYFAEGGEVEEKCLNTRSPLLKAYPIIVVPVYRPQLGPKGPQHSLRRESDPNPLRAAESQQKGSLRCLSSPCLHVSPSSRR